MLRNRISRFSFSSSYFFRLPYRTLLPPSNTSFPLLSSRIRNNPRLRESTIVRFHSHPLSFFPYPSTPLPLSIRQPTSFCYTRSPSHPWFRAHFRRPKSCAVLTPWINFAPSTNHRRAIIALSLSLPCSRLSSILQREERERGGFISAANSSLGEEEEAKLGVARHFGHLRRPSFEEEGKGIAKRREFPLQWEFLFFNYQTDFLDGKNEIEEEE